MKPRAENEEDSVYWLRFLGGRCLIYRDECLMAEFPSEQADIALAYLRDRQGGAAHEHERDMSEALADPIVQALMAADRVDPKSVAELMRRMADRLAHRAFE